MISVQRFTLPARRFQRLSDRKPELLGYGQLRGRFRRRLYLRTETVFECAIFVDGACPYVNVRVHKPQRVFRPINIAAESLDEPFGLLAKQDDPRLIDISLTTQLSRRHPTPRTERAAKVTALSIAAETANTLITAFIVPTPRDDLTSAAIHTLTPSVRKFRERRFPVLSVTGREEPRGLAFLTIGQVRLRVV